MLALAAALVYSGRITRPLRDLTDAAQKLDEGRLDLAVYAEGKDEVAALSSSFNGMVSRVKDFTMRVDPTGETTALQLDVLKHVPQSVGEDDHVRMQRELVRAMAKPVEKRRWIMVIDLRKCVGCHSCTIGCIAENKLPPGVVYRPVVTHEIGTYPNVRLQFLPRPCMHCENPSCVPIGPCNLETSRRDSGY